MKKHNFKSPFLTQVNSDSFGSLYKLDMDKLQSFYEAKKATLWVIHRYEFEDDYEERYLVFGKLFRVKFHCYIFCHNFSSPF